VISTERIVTVSMVIVDLVEGLSCVYESGGCIIGTTLGFNINQTLERKRVSEWRRVKAAGVYIELKYSRLRIQ
jgi:hypothetical protein